MSRNFKFRAWHEESGKIKDFSFEDIIIKYIDFSECILNHWVSINDLIIMQYLGADCKDEDGKEICEGDIVKLFFDQGSASTEVICIVEYRSGSFLFRNIHKKNGCDELFYIDTNMEFSKIIGNTHQNPELLQEVKK